MKVFGKGITDILSRKTNKDKQNNEIVVMSKLDVAALVEKIVFNGSDNVVCFGRNCVFPEGYNFVIRVTGNGNVVRLENDSSINNIAITIKGNNNAYLTQSMQNLSNFVVSVEGNGNMLDVGERVYTRGSSIAINGNSNTISVEKYCELYGTTIALSPDNNELKIGAGVIINASERKPTSFNVIGGRKIEVGEGSLFSNAIEMHTTDYHGIYDRDGNRINSDKDIKIGKHVWVGIGATILKGTEISNGCIIGAGTVISGKTRTPNSIIAGNPAKVIKQDVFWAHERKDKMEGPDTYFFED